METGKACIEVYEEEKQKSDTAIASSSVNQGSWAELVKKYWYLFLIVGVGLWLSGKTPQR